MSTYDRKQTLATLTQLAGEAFTEESVIHQGTQIILPEGMGIRRSIGVLTDLMNAEEEVTRFSRTFKYRPLDGAAATERALKAVTGTSGTGKTLWGMFGASRPTLYTVNVDVDETIQVPGGALNIELFGGTLYFDYHTDAELGNLFNVMIEAPRKYRAAIEGFFRAIQAELEERSIYRGKAIDGRRDNPEFLDLSGVDSSKVVYSNEVAIQLEANVWSMLDHTEVMLAHDIPLKRSVLMHGPYGTGKTLAAFLTAQRAVANGWSFIYCRPGKDDLSEVMQTARLYQPAVVFFEDVDIVSEGTVGRDNVARLLDLFDGVQAKGTQLLAILTTNHVDRIHKGMVRPGRLDAIIEISQLDDLGVEKLIKANTTPESIKEVEFNIVVQEMKDFTPAFVKEATDRAKRYAIARSGTVDMVTTEDLRNAALGLRGHLALMDAAADDTSMVTVDTALSRIINEGTMTAINDYYNS